MGTSSFCCSDCKARVKDRAITNPDEPALCEHCTVALCIQQGTHPLVVPGVYKKSSRGCESCQKLQNSQTTRSSGTDSKAEREAKGQKPVASGQQWGHAKYIAEAAAKGFIIERKQVETVLGWPRKGLIKDHVAVLNQIPLLKILESPLGVRPSLLLALFAHTFVHPDAPARDSSPGELAAVHAQTALGEAYDGDGLIGSFDVRPRTSLHKA